MIVEPLPGTSFMTGSGGGRTYKTRDRARSDVFDYIEFFYKPKRKHVRNGMLSPVEFERQLKLNRQGV